MKNVLITGISTGIGYDATKYLIQKGFFVFGSVRKEKDKLRLESEFPHNLKVLLFDVTDKEKIAESFEEVKSHLNGSPLDVLINNAGMAVPGPQVLLDDERFRYQMEVNFFAVRTMINTYSPLIGATSNFEGTPGKIINISSISGLMNNPFIGSYCVSKHALESLSEVYRREFLQFGVDVININPGPILSEIWDKNMGKMDEFLDSDYGATLKRADKVISDSKKNALPLRKCSELIYKVIMQDKPSINNILMKGKIPFKIMRLLPRRLADKLIKSQLLR